ncbi:MAG: hypothetical protein R3F56_01060 [Planctomycetota bacterium]
MREQRTAYVPLIAGLGFLLPSCSNTTGTPEPDQLAAVQRDREDHDGENPERLREWRRQALLDEKGEIAPGAMQQARAQVEALRQTQGVATTGFNANNWRAGPNNLAGRMRTLSIDPRNANVMVAGAASGGIWRTTNGGTSWVPVGDMLPSLSISDIVRSNASPDTLVASTGELFVERGPGGIPFGGSGEAIQGAGIYRSVDNGLTWALVSMTPVEAFHMDISTADVILATTETGIQRSTDLGTTWTPVLGGLNMDVSFHPTDPLRVVAGGTLSGLQFGTVSVINTLVPLTCVTLTNQVPFMNAFLFSSSDGGVTWTASTPIRFERATAAQIGRQRCPPATGALMFEPVPTRWEVEYHNNSTAYAVNDLGQVFRSTNNGGLWSRIGNAGVGLQAFYDLTLWVDRSDTDTNVTNDLVVVGGVVLRRSTNGGVNFTQISNDLVAGSAHDDHHALVEDPGLLTGNNRTLFAVTDGGIFRADDIDTVATGTWVARNNGMATTQFYGASTHPITRRTVGGTQDQGGLRTQNFAPFSEIIDTGITPNQTLGDAGFSAVDPTDDTFAYLTGTDLEIFRSTDGGLTARQMGPTNGADFPNFFAPMILHPDNNNRLLIGGQNLYQSTNPRATTPTWTIIKSPVTGTNPIAAVAASQPTTNDPDVIWVAHNSTLGGASRVFFTRTGGGTATGSWTEENFARPNRLPMRITIDPNDPMHVFLCLGGFAADNLWERVPTGTTTGVWQQINTPVNAPVRDFEIDPTDPNCFVLATQVGLFVSPNRGATWQVVSPANVSIEETYWSRGHLFLATYGRGLFSQTPFGTASAVSVGIPCDLNGTPTAGPVLDTELPELGLTVVAKTGQGSPNTFVVLTFGDPPPGPVPPCGAQSVNFFVFSSQVSDSSGNTRFNVALPNDPAFAGGVLIAQAAEFQSSGAIVVSNGMRWTFGF